MLFLTAFGTPAYGLPSSYSMADVCEIRIGATTGVPAKCLELSAASRTITAWIALENVGNTTTVSNV